jgi:hypothetical protein
MGRNKVIKIRIEITRSPRGIKAPFVITSIPIMIEIINWDIWNFQNNSIEDP